MSLDAPTLPSRSHGLDEFCAMFALTDRERQLSILACNDAPSSFNAEGTATGMRIVSADALYTLREQELRARIGATDSLQPAASAAIERFLADYETGVAQGRYVNGNACELPFPDGSYDLALCVHTLFGADAEDLAWHLRALRELMRVAEEVRIFPLQSADGTASRHLRAALMALQRMGYRTECRAVPCGFLRGTNQMLSITR